MSLCYIPGWTGAAIPTQYAVLSAVLPFTLWRQGQLTVFHWLGVGFVTYAAVSLIWNTDFYGGIYGFWLLCILALCFWLGSTLQSLRDVYAGLAIGGAVSSAVAVMQALGYNSVPGNGGIYFNSVAQGEILALIVIALLTERMWLLALPLLPGIVLSQSRGAWLALGIGVLALYVRKTWLLAIVAVLVVMVMVVGSSSDAQRLWIWTAAYNELTFFGNGVGSFASQMYSDGLKPIYPEYVHNDALQLVYEYGIAALAPIFIFAFVLSRTKKREWPVVLAFVVMGFYSFPLFMAVTSFVGMVTAGRTVRDWNLARRFSDYCRSTVDARLRQSSSAVVPVVS